LSSASCSIDLDDGERCSNPEGSIQDINTKDDGVSLTESSNGLEATRPNGLRGSISSLGFSNLCIVCREGIEEVIDNVGCE